MKESAFFTNDDLETVISASKTAINRLTLQLIENKIVLWPLAGIGNGLAQLEQRAPKIHQYYNDQLEYLIQITQVLSSRKLSTNPETRK